MRHIFLGFASIFLCVQHTHSCGIKYVSKDAAAAHNEWVAEQEAIAAAEAAMESEYYYYDEDPAPRFFFSQISQIFSTTRDLPCCKEGDIRQTQTTTEPTGPRLKNATRCGRKSYQRIIGGDITNENEFPWQCALLNSDGSFFGCSAVLLSCDPVILVTAAHCFVQNPEPSDITVACGAHRIERPDPSPQDRNE